MRKIIVPTGYMGSGSSAVTDLVAEYKNCNNDYRSFEYVFLHCPNGLFDLEDKLLIGGCRLIYLINVLNFTLEKTMEVPILNIYSMLKLDNQDILIGIFSIIPMIQEFMKKSSGKYIFASSNNLASLIFPL